MSGQISEAAEPPECQDPSAKRCWCEVVNGTRHRADGCPEHDVATAPIAVVEWIDSSLQNGQVDKSAFPEPEKISSLGWLVHEEDTHVVIARDDMNNGDWRGLLCVPRECIKNVRRG